MISFFALHSESGVRSCVRRQGSWIEYNIKKVVHSDKHGQAFRKDSSVSQLEIIGRDMSHL